MNVEQFREYCLAKQQVTEHFPFDEHTLVFKVAGKMFALCGLERIPFQINLKCDPEQSEALRAEYDGCIIPGYHMSKKHWNTLFVQQLSPQLVTELIDHSYELVIQGMPKKIRETFS